MYDVIIVGQGLAGSLLAIALIERGLSVLVIDDGLKSSATKVAAGMMNPVTGKRLVKLWQSTEAEASVCAYYKNLEKLLDATFLHCFKQYRFLSRPEELRALPKRLADAEYRDYMTSISTNELETLNKICDVGDAQFSIERVYQLNTVCFLDAVKTYLLAHDAYRLANFDYADIQLSESNVSWQGIDGTKMVFCEGAKGAENPFFKDILEFQNAYGHIINIQLPKLKERLILNHGKWLCPDLRHGAETFRYGTTTYWEDINGNAGIALTALKDSLHEFLKTDYVIDSVENEIRPVMRDREAKSLCHPVYTQLGIINGLGGQGISRCPLLIPDFIETLLNP